MMEDETRRIEALKRAAQIEAAGATKDGSFDSARVILMARRFEEYLKTGKDTP